jgi:outer membrane protein assembly factor BamA
MMTSLTRLRTGELGQTIPSYLSYNLGGANTIRGWNLDARHGKNEMINSVEYLYSLMKPRPLSLKGVNLYLGIRLAAFTDFGIAWADSQDFNSGTWIAGAGVGIRLLIPFLEVIRFDLAYGEPGAGIHSHTGIQWKADRQRPRVR